MSVNLTPRQLQQSDFAQTVRDVLDETQLPPHLLTLELTESSLARETDEMMQRLWALRNLGVGLALSDFGTGYSSLSSLRHFPFDSVKIDRSFVEGIDTDADQAAVVRAIVTLAHALRMKTVGDGVESARQARRLCDFAQGDQFARPMRAELTEAWLWPDIGRAA